MDFQTSRGLLLSSLNLASICSSEKSLSLRHHPKIHPHASAYRAVDCPWIRDNQFWGWEWDYLANKNAQSLSKKPEWLLHGDKVLLPALIFELGIFCMCCLQSEIRCNRPETFSTMCWSRLPLHLKPQCIDKENVILNPHHLSFQFFL